jgi:hypothetical protein
MSVQEPRARRTRSLTPNGSVLGTVVRRRKAFAHLALMLVSLLMAVAIPQAFEAHALLFAGSYVAIQIGRHSFLTFAAADRGTVERERAGHILTWFAVVGVLWVTGALLDGVAGLFRFMGVKHPPFERLFVEEDGVVVRLAPREDLLGIASAKLAKQLGLRRVYVLHDSANDGWRIEHADPFRRAARRLGLQVSGSGEFNPAAKSYDGMILPSISFAVTCAPRTSFSGTGLLRDYPRGADEIGTAEPPKIGSGVLCLTQRPADAAHDVAAALGSRLEAVPSGPEVRGG